VQDIFIGWKLFGSQTFNMMVLRYMLSLCCCHLIMPIFIYMKMRHEELEFIFNWGNHAIIIGNLAL